MKNLKILSYKVKPVIPIANSLVIVGNEIYYYDENNKEYLLKEEPIDLLDLATKSELDNYAPIVHTHTYDSITGKPSTFTPTIGSTATTAKAGNYVPSWSEITGKPSTFAPVIGTTVTTAKAGNYTPSATEVFNALNNMTSDQIENIKILLNITTP